MTERSSGKPLDTVSFQFTCELVAIPRYDQEILDVDSNRLAVRAPERSYGVEQERQGVHSEIVQLLVLVPIGFFQGGQLCNL